MKGVYTYDYPRPMVTVDALVFSGTLSAPRVLLIERGRAPFAGCWALPGGFVDMDESLEAAVARELREETGLDRVALSQLHAFGDPGRDPRGRSVSVVYWGRVTEIVPVQAGDDAARVDWFPLVSLPALAFDHGRIVAYGASRLDGLYRNKLEK